MRRDRVAEAIALPAKHRREIVEAFFRAHPGHGVGRLGLGRAVADFVEWEIRSGRIVDGEGGPGGSPWWRLANGGMVLDLRDALTPGGEGDRDATGPVAMWVEYARLADAGAPVEAQQASMWAAHQASLHAALDAAAELLAREQADEQRFAHLVVEVVDRTAAACRPTDTDELARHTERSYPDRYPITAEQWAALHARFAPYLALGDAG